MKRLIDRLIVDGILLCPACCLGKISAGMDVLRCENCRAQWPVRNGVADFSNSFPCEESDSGNELYEARTGLTSGEVEAKIIEVLNLPDEEAVKYIVADILRRAACLSCNDSALTAEIKDVSDRFCPPGEEVKLSAPADDSNRHPEAVFEKHYFCPSIPAGIEFSANVRIRNVGGHPISSRVDNPLVVAAQWLGEPCKPSSTAFPVDISPNRAISLPLKLRSPSRPGPKILQISLAKSGSLEAIGRNLRIPIRIGAEQAWIWDFQHIGNGPRIPDYSQDHADAVGIIEQSLRATGKSTYRVLEVGSGTHPHMAWTNGCELIAIDISSPLLELGSLYFADKLPERLTLLCADAMNPPFKPQSFDAVVMFSALHHFQEPEILLKRLAKLTKPQGFIAVMCEPVGDTICDHRTLRDLLKGINEQVFSLSEYRWIFNQAGLTEVRIGVDGTSLKAVLHTTHGGREHLF